MNTIKEIIKDHIEWRHQIFKLAKADLVKTYSGAALGWAWTLIKPTVNIFVYWFAFTFGLKAAHGPDGYPYVLWLIAGLIPWFFMSDMIVQGARSITRYRHLVTKLKFPVSTIPTFVGLGKAFVHICLMVIVIIVYALFGYYPDIYMLQLPFYMAFMVVFFILWSLFSSMLSAMSKDFFNLIRSLTTAIFWLSGIMWDINKIDIPWLKTLLEFNPVTFIATGYRNVFIYKKWFFEDLQGLGAVTIVLVVMAVLAVWSYRKLIKEIPDVL